MQLREIFAKDVARPIEGVIKADDVEYLGTEIDEFVLTNEASKELEKLLEAYTDYTNSNGVWISGFFGSGKSHLLKMLAHLLGDVQGQEYPRDLVTGSFISKAQGSILPALLKKSANIPAKSLLFNIDQKATVITKDQNDALLRVFVKVFDESRGYYGNQGHVARFERDLDNRGLYSEFKQSYKQIAGRPWTQGREEGVLEESNVAKAYAEVCGQADTPTNILTKYRSEYAVSIEDFADEVTAWVDKQESGFRLNFFVDEVGQFIGSNTHLMLNLQTIAESLNTKCKGRAWVFVTSQEDMDKVVGDRTKQQGIDFSKIQARFATRMKLTSADVEEVIRRRLLDKNETGALELKKLYVTEQPNFKTLFDFVDGAKSYRNYADDHHFIGTYPMVPYQFPLFQGALIGLSDHNVFEGRNSSVGERSMLGVVQEVAKNLGDAEIGTLATFDQLFAGIRQSLIATSQRAIYVAERNLENELAIKLLKALFLVKYVDGFNATPRNLAVLVYDKFGLDLSTRFKQVQEALTLLEAQTYVQRNGNTYEYLTNDEKDIEQEIKNVDLDSSEASARLNKIISADVFRSSKLRYEMIGQDFAFGFKLDDQPYGQQKELTLHFVSPAFDASPEAIRMQSASKDELRIVLDDDGRLHGDLMLLLQTEKYLRLKRSTSLTATEERILLSKSAFNTEREKELVGRVRKSIGNAQLIVNASDIDARSNDAIPRITAGFQELVARTYTQLSLLGGVIYTEQQIAGFANPADGETLIDARPDSLQPAAEEVLSHIIQQLRLGANVTAKAVVARFEAKPYGWHLPAIQCALARLVANGSITLTVDGNVLKRTEVAGMLRNTQKHPFVTIAEQRKFDARKVKAFHVFCTEFFDDGYVSKDPQDLARYGAEKLAEEHRELTSILTTGQANYPFLVSLQKAADLLVDVVGKPSEWYLEEFGPHVDGLLEAKEDVIDPVRTFLNGAQKSIFDGAASLLKTQGSNLLNLAPGADTQVREILNDPNAFRGNKIQRLKQASSELQETITAAVDAARSEQLSTVEGRHRELRASDAYTSATDSSRNTADRKTDEVADAIRRQVQIILIKQIGSDFEERVYPDLLDALYASVQPPDKDNDGEGPTPPVKVTTVSVKLLKVPHTKTLLTDTDDVDAYLDEYRRVLIATINSGKRITL